MNKQNKPSSAFDDNEPYIQIAKDGPYIVHGDVPLSEDAIAPSDDNSHLIYRHVRDFEAPNPCALCRCGASKHKPFCDGSHEHIHFDGTETASRAPYKQRAEAYRGDALTLGDDGRCAYARLCHYNGVDVWDLTLEAEEGSELKREAVAAAWHCPTGRLVSIDNATGKTYEQNFEPSIVVLEDTEEGVSGPLFIRGGIELIDEDGRPYEKRNRYALCRCGHSHNKPFCDAIHINAGFFDGSPALDDSWEGKPDSTFAPSPKVE
jgi:CDGSH-type Zn-finger protein